MLKGDLMIGALLSGITPGFALSYNIDRTGISLRFFDVDRKGDARNIQQFAFAPPLVCMYLFVQAPLLRRNYPTISPHGFRW